MIVHDFLVLSWPVCHSRYLFKSLGKIFLEFDSFKLKIPWYLIQNQDQEVHDYLLN